MPATIEKTQEEFNASLDDALDRGNAPVDAPVDPEADEQTVDAVEKPDPEVPEPEAADPATLQPEAPAEVPSGPSREWTSIAQSRGVPNELIALARDDDQLQQYIALLDGPDSEEPPAEKAKAPTLKVDEILGDAEFDPADPVHKQVRALVSQNNQMAAALEALAGQTNSMAENLRKERQVQTALSMEKDFDDALDAMAIEDFGARGSKTRGSIYPIYDALVAADPRTPRSELAKRAAYAVRPEILTARARQAQLAAVEGQQGKKLGGGPAKAAAVKAPTLNDKFNSVLDGALRRGAE